MAIDAFIFGYFAKKGLDKVWQKATEKELIDKLDACVKKWAKNLPEEFYLHSDSFFLSQASNYELLPDVQKIWDMIEQFSIPDKESIFRALVANWLYIKAERKGNQEFYLKEYSQVLPYLRDLSEKMSYVFNTEESLFRNTMVKLYEKLTERKENTVEHLSTASLIPFSSDNFVFFDGFNKYEPDGNFNFYCEFIFKAKPGGEILSFDAMYFSDGCPCLGQEHMIAINGENKKVESSGIFDSPFSIQSGKSYRIQYRKNLRPTLKQQIPAECDNGEIKVGIKYQYEHLHEAETYFFCYRYRGNGLLKVINNISDIPGLTDEEILFFKECGRINHDQFANIINAPALNRYLAATTLQPKKSGYEWYGFNWEYKLLLSDLLFNNIPQEIMQRRANRKSKSEEH